MESEEGLAGSLDITWAPPFRGRALRGLWRLDGPVLQPCTTTTTSPWCVRGLRPCPFASCVFNLERSGSWDSLFLGFPAVTTRPTPVFSLKRAQAVAKPPSSRGSRALEQATPARLHTSEQTRFQIKNPLLPQPSQVSAAAGLPGGTCPSLTSARHVGTPGTFPGPLYPAGTQRREAAILLRDLPSEGRKRPPWSPINHGILFCNIGQMKRCGDPRPCVLWRGESFSSHAGAKHLPVSPQPGEPAPLLFILPPGTLTLSLLQPGAGGCGARVRPPAPGPGQRRGRESGISAGCGSGPSPVPAPAPGLASASSPESCWGKMPRSALLEEISIQREKQ